MTTPVEKEIEAIGTVLEALTPLSIDARRAVLEYVVKRLDIPFEKLANDIQSATMPAPDSSSIQVRYVLRSRQRNRSQRGPTERATELIENLAGDVARAVYTRASASTHSASPREEVLRIKRYVDTVLIDLLEIPEPEYTVLEA